MSPPSPSPSPTSYQHGTNNYGAVPNIHVYSSGDDTDDASFHNNDANGGRSNQGKKLYIGTACLLLTCLVASILDDKGGRQLQIGSLRNNLKLREEFIGGGYDKMTLSDLSPPTLLPGGGRDWTLNLAEQTISPKHNDTFVLGSFPHQTLVLTNRGDPNQLTFPSGQLEALTKGESVSLSGIGLQLPNEGLKEWGIFNFKELGVSNALSLKVQYLDGNFLAWNDGQGHDMVLDISLGLQVAGNAVNVVCVKDGSGWWRWIQPKTFQYGGGRDWVVNQTDGTISSKHVPDLVLGYGPINLMLTEKGSPMTNKFQNLDALASGKPTKLVLTSGDKGIGFLGDEEEYVGQWRFIDTGMVPADEAIPLKLIEDNYIATDVQGLPDKDALVLDVAFWKMFDGNTVNFVGGWSWEKEDVKDDDYYDYDTVVVKNDSK